MRKNTSTVELIKTKCNNGNRRFEKKDIIVMNIQIRINGIMDIEVTKGIDVIMNIDVIMDINKNEIDVSDGKKKEKRKNRKTALRLVD